VYLEQTIDSVLSQNYSNLEYIVIDGGSTDGTVTIIKKYEKYLTYWESQPDRGQSHAINKGVKRATGEIINWLNSDDYYEPDALKIVNEAFQNTSINCFTGRSNIFNERGIIKISKGADIYQNNLAKTIGWARIDQPETFFRKEVWDNVGMLNEHLHYVMDKEWWIRYLLKYGLNGIEKSNNIVVNFRSHDKSKSESNKHSFIEEGFIPYLSLATIVNDFNYIELVRKHFNIASNTFYDYYLNMNQRSIEEALNYNVLYLSDYLYYNNDYVASTEFLKKTDFSMLDLNNKLFYLKLSALKSVKKLI